MALDPGTAVYTDFAALTRLKASARADKSAAIGTVARQFETLFTQMLLKSMRSASFGGGILDSQQSKAYRDLADQQLALTLSTRGRGLGIAAMLERQLGAKNGAAAPAAHALNPLPARPARMLAQQSSTADAASDAPDPVADVRTVGEALRPALAATYRAIDGAANGALERARSALPESPEAFVRTMLPHAKAAAEKLGVSVRAVLAHAALETGWGRHLPHAANGASSNNLFGIKAGSSWDGATARVATTEYENGAAVRRVDAFRAYASPTAAFDDYAGLIAGNPRYAGALGHGDDIAAFARGLQQGGYATDPAYAAKLARIANSAPMREALAALKNPAALPST